MPKKAKPGLIPEGYHTVTPYLIVHGVPTLIDFLVVAFGAKERLRLDNPDGSVSHAELELGDSVSMMGEASAEWKPLPGSIHLYVDDTDDLYARALKAGATSVREPADQLYGDRSAGVKDASGNYWWLATHVEDVSPEEMERRAKAQAKP